MRKNLLFAVIILLFLPFVANAQKRLAKLTADVHKQDHVDELIFSERRDPRTRELVESTRVLRIKNPSVAKKLIDAMHDERERATAFRTNQSYLNNSTYFIEFVDFERRKATNYTLIQKHPNEWTLHIQQKNCPVPPRNHTQTESQLDPVSHLLTFTDILLSQ